MDYFGGADINEDESEKQADPAPDDSRFWEHFLVF
jgi:hypothetical protein